MSVLNYFANLFQLDATASGQSPRPGAIPASMRAWEFWDFTLATPKLTYPDTAKALVFAFATGTTDTNGLATIYLTDDKTGTGNALFSKIWMAIPIGISNVPAGVGTPLASIQSIDYSGRKSVTGVAVQGASNVLGLTSSIIKAAGITLNYLIIAER